MIQKIWTVVKRGVQWLVKSSANVNKYSVTIKAFLYGLIPVAVYVSGMYDVKLDSASLTEAVNVLGQTIILFGGVVTGITALVGLVRKIVTTFQGENDVVASWQNED